MRTLMLAGLLAFATVTEASSAQEKVPPLATAEQARVSDLMYRALKAGRREAEAARNDQRLSAFDRRNAQGQFALMILTAGQCDDAASFIETHDEILAGSIERMFLRARLEGGRACLTKLASLMVQRWQDDYFDPAGQVRLRYQAAAYLDAAGRPDAGAIMDEAEAELTSLHDKSTLWAARSSAVSAYSGTPKYMPYLEYLADKMITDRLMVGTIDANGFLTLFAGRGRCDLVEKVVRNGSKSCDPYKQFAEGMYINPRLPDNAVRFTPPPLEDTSLARALDNATPWSRLTKLLELVGACKAALKPA